MSDVKTWRQDLHQIPELGLQEFKTTKYLKDVLTSLGYQPMELLETGVYVYIDNQKETTLAFRSDIDALEIQECNVIDYASKHAGYMHACGHDGHMAALLGFAQKLKQVEQVYNHNFLLLFQPAEESPGGAKLVVESGILEKYNVKAIFGMHLMPSIEEGVVASKAGPFMATNGELDVEIHGKSAHAGLYHQGVDSIVIASQLMNQYQSIVSRKLSPFEPSVIHIGSIEGGTARNIVADKTVLKGTIRAFDEKAYALITSNIENINKGMEQATGCTITCTCPSMYPPVINDETLYKQFIQYIPGEYLELKEPLMLAEDFSYYQKALPGIFFYLGTRTKQYTSGLHTETFNFNESVLLQAVETYYQLACNI